MYKKAIWGYCILLLCGCTGGFKSATMASSNTPAASTAPPSTPTSGNQWSAAALASSSCSGTYQLTSNGAAMVMTIFAEVNGNFTGIVSSAGQANQAISGTCANGQMNFTIAGQQYSGTYGK